MMVKMLRGWYTILCLMIINGALNSLKMNKIEKCHFLAKSDRVQHSFIKKLNNLIAITNIKCIFAISKELII